MFTLSGCEEPSVEFRSSLCSRQQRSVSLTWSSRFGFMISAVILTLTTLQVSITSTSLSLFIFQSICIIKALADLTPTSPFSRSQCCKQSGAKKEITSSAISYFTSGPSHAQASGVINAPRWPARRTSLILTPCHRRSLKFLGVFGLEDAGENNTRKWNLPLLLRGALAGHVSAQ